jgi:hypothetical protein
LFGDRFQSQLAANLERTNIGEYRVINHS